MAKRQHAPRTGNGLISWGSDGPPFYPLFIKRDAAGVRTHHIHVVEMGFAEHWDRVLFRDYLIAHPETAAQYATLKRRLAAEFKVTASATPKRRRPSSLR